MTQQEKEDYWKKYWPTFDFEPKFFILDKRCKWVMAVREEDRYEYKGVYLAYYGRANWKQWAACMNRQNPHEYYPTFDFTKDEVEAFLWAYNNQYLPDTNNVQRERIEGYPSY